MQWERVIKETEGRVVGMLATGNVWLDGWDTTLLIARCQSILLPPQKPGLESGWHWVTPQQQGSGGSGQTEWQLIVRGGDIWIKHNASRGRFAKIQKLQDPAPLFLPLQQFTQWKTLCLWILWICNGDFILHKQPKKNNSHYRKLPFQTYYKNQTAFAHTVY